MSQSEPLDSVQPAERERIAAELWAMDEAAEMGSDGRPYAPISWGKAPQWGRDEYLAKADRILSILRPAPEAEGERELPEYSGIGGVYDVFTDAEDAAQQMALYLREIEKALDAANPSASHDRLNIIGRIDELAARADVAALRAPTEREPARSMYLSRSSARPESYSSVEPQQTEAEGSKRIYRNESTPETKAMWAAVDAAAAKVPPAIRERLVRSLRATENPNERGGGVSELTDGGGYGRTEPHFATPGPSAAAQQWRLTKNEPGNAEYEPAAPQAEDVEASGAGVEVLLDRALYERGRAARSEDGDYSIALDAEDELRAAVASLRADRDRLERDKASLQRRLDIALKMADKHHRGDRAACERADRLERELEEIRWQVRSALEVLQETRHLTD